MELLAKKERLNELYDLYQKLLTDKQRSFFELYYHEDYSLQEVAEVFKVSRNAVHDHLKKVEEHLNAYEEKLSLHAQRVKRLSLMDQYDKTKDSNILDALRKLDE